MLSPGIGLVLPEFDCHMPKFSMSRETMPMRAKYAVMALLLSMTLLPARMLFAQVEPAAVNAVTDQIAFVQNGQVWHMNVDGSQKTKWDLPGMSDPNSPQWSPDGSQLAFTAYSNPRRMLAVMNANGSNLHTVD